MSGFIERYRDRIVGVLPCFDRVVVYGSMTEICNKFELERYLRRNEIPLERFADFFQVITNQIKKNAEAVAEANELKIEWIGRKYFRKEKRIKEILAERGDAPGLVHIFKAVEVCNTFDVRMHRTKKHRFICPDSAKCLHYYFYFIHPIYGLCYVRVPTRMPFRLQFYFNGHNWLAKRLESEGITFTQVENAFLDLGDFERAAELTRDFDTRELQQVLEQLAQQYCPVSHRFPRMYRWNVMQLEHSVDVIFDCEESLSDFYNHVIRVASCDVKAEEIASFMGRELDAKTKAEISSIFKTRIQGTCIRHKMGKVSIKMYDKFGRILRVETTTNDVTFFKQRRIVSKRDGTEAYEIAKVKKWIHSLPAMIGIMHAANKRYLEFISAMDDPSSGNRHLRKISEPVRQNKRSHRGFNLFNDEDLNLVIAILQGEFNISGVRNRDLQRLLGKTSSQISRILKRLSLHGLIKKVAHTYKYYLTKLGKCVLVCGLHLRESLIVPALAGPDS